MHRFPRRSLVLISALVLAWSVASAASAQEQPIAITIDGATVTATGLTPGGPVVVVAGWWTRSYGIPDLAELWRGATATAGGDVSVTFDRPVPETSLVVVADVTSGRIELLDSGRARFRRVAMPARRLTRGADGGDYDDMLSPHERALIVVIRPGVGAWVQAAYDGGIGDHDGLSNRSIRTDPSSMEAVAQSPPAPKKIRPKDVVLLLNAQAGIFASTEVPQ